MATEHQLLESWRQLPPHQQQQVLNFVEFLQATGSLSRTGATPHLGEKLLAIRERIVASGIPLWTAEQVDREVVDRRGGYSDDSDLY